MIKNKVYTAPEAEIILLRQEGRIMVASYGEEGNAGPELGEGDDIDL